MRHLQLNLWTMMIIKNLDLSFEKSSIGEEILMSDYADTADYEISSIMEIAKKLFNEQEDILNEHSRPTNYISTNRVSENLSSQERLLNAIKHGLKKESCKSNNKEIKQYCKEDMDKDDTDGNEEKNGANGDEQKVGNAKNDNIFNEDNKKFFKNNYTDYIKDTQITKQIENFLKENDANEISRRGSSSEKGAKETAGMCNPMKYTISCDPSKRWRHINGTCNNIEKPHWGSIVIILRRFSKRTYDDGPMGYIPQGGWTQNKIPKARFISETLSHPKWPFSFEGGKKHARHRSQRDDIPSDLFTHMTVSWGQFVAHEISRTTEPERDCCNKAILEGQKMLPYIARVCWNIDISRDVFFKNENITCHPFSRSNFFICPKNSEHPGVHQVNGVTAFLDGSAVYGEDKIKNLKLREMKGGLLKTGRNKTHKVVNKLPEAHDCGFKSGNFYVEDEKTEVAGDTRAALHPSLASMHTLFMVEHNRIAKELKKRLQHLKLPKGITLDELLFQETRIIIIAIQQKIVYNDYLHSVLGNEKWRSNNFPISPSKYFPNEDASIRNEFATAAFRFGHSNVDGRWDPVSTDVNNKIGKIIPEFASNTSIPSFWPLRWHYFDTALFVTSFNGEEWNEELLGTIHQPAQKTDLLVSDDLTDYLFSKSFQKMLPSELIGDKKGDFPAQDLVARNIHRGRDHGLATYNDMRKFCKLHPLINFKQHPKEISLNAWNELAKAYNNVNQIDFYMGGYAEIPLKGAMVGPTFACIIEKQFQLLKQGDRYFFSHRQGPNHKGVSHILYKEILKRTLGDMMCTNIVILKNNGTQRDVFRLKNDQNNPYIPCKQRQDLNFHKIAKDILQFYNKGERLTQLKPNQKNVTSAVENKGKSRKAQPKIKGQSTKPSERDKEGCSCINHRSSRGYGNCKKYSKKLQDKICYVYDTSSCSDKKKSSTEVGLFTSAQACKSIGCSCINHISSKGYGNCKKYSKKLQDKICYVYDTSSCSDKKKSSTEVGLFTSVHACKSMGCSCINHISSKGYGNCKKYSKELQDKICYVYDTSSCSDKKKSSTEVGLFTSAHACKSIEKGNKKVSCGGHSGPTCSECGKAAQQCNGDCKWVGGKCIIKSEKGNKKVSCGGHSAPTCSECGKAAQQCNDDCKWVGGKCIIKKR